MPGSSSWMPYAPQGVKGRDDYYYYYHHHHIIIVVVGVVGVATAAFTLYNSTAFY
jgi:hypothetical protein